MKTIKHKLHEWLYEEYEHYLNMKITAFLAFLLFLSFILVETAPKHQEKKEVEHECGKDLDLLDLSYSLPESLSHAHNPYTHQPTNQDSRGTTPGS